MRVFGEVLVGWLRFKLQTYRAEASKATVEEMHQRAVDTRCHSRSLLGVLC